MRETSNILIACNGSPCSDAALNDLRHAGLPAVFHALVLTVADIMLLPSGDEGGEGGMQAIRIPEVERRAQEKAEKAIREARVCAEREAKRVKADFPGWEVKAEVECDFPAWAVIKMADRLGSDLVVVGGHRRSAAGGRLILGSTSQRVLYEAPCSVRVARFSEDRRARPIRIVVGFDGSQHTRAGVDAVASRAWPAGSGVRLVTAGRERRVPARELVLGDLILLATGDKVPADVRLVEAVNLQTVEAALTGESAPVEKHTDALEDKRLPTGDRKNMAYAGTAVTYGRGSAVVVATGMATEFGRIARMLDSVETGKTPLQENLDRVGKALARAAFAVVIVIVALGSSAANHSSRWSSSAWRWRSPSSPRRCRQSSPSRSHWASRGWSSAMHPCDASRPSRLSEAKRMTTLHETPDGVTAYAKGAPEVILGSCAFQLTERGEEPLDDARRAKALETAQRMAGDAPRVMAVAYKGNAAPGDAETGMTLLGLIGMIDPPRPEARAAVRECEEAGIKVVIITGDHPLTARAVADELGLSKGGRIVTGAELEKAGDEELERVANSAEAYARVSPAHKLRVVAALQKRGHVVAMTGDGVNDAPALKKADIGIAMGITGTDVSKEAATTTLIDDNFASIVAAVGEGRGIFSNIKKYLMYLLSSNIGEIGLMTGAKLAGLPLPLSAVQIPYVNLATDGLPALALAVAPPEQALMRRPPRDPRAGIFTRPVVVLMLVGGLWSMGINLGLFVWALDSGRSVGQAMTMTFVSLVMIQFFKAYNFRSDRHSVLHRPFANEWLNLAIFWELLMLALVLYVPLLERTFGTIGLSAGDWLIIVAAAFTVSPVIEAAKWAERRGWFGELH